MTCQRSTDRSRLTQWWRRARVSALVAVIVFGALAPACGKKGPPLAPLVRLPGPAEPFVARRLGSTVYVRFTVPAKNQDNSTPADLSRVDVYGYTGVPASDDDIVKLGTRVASVPVRRPPTREEEDRARGEKSSRGRQAAKGGSAPQEKAKQAADERAAEPGFEQGAVVTVTEAWTAAFAEAVLAPERSSKKRSAANPTAPAPAMMPIASAADIPTRVYVAVGVNRKGHRGAFSRHAAVPVAGPPAPPGDLKLSHTETAITLEWTPPPGAPVAVQTPTDAEALRPKRLPLVEGATWSYEVYDVTPKEQPQSAAPRAQAPSPPPALPMPMVDLPPPLNQQPLAKTAFTDSPLEFGKERCYCVRTLKAFGALQEESEPTQAACITPRDTYPPAAPKGLTAVVNSGVVSLIWDPNGEKDLEGYFVLRGEAPDGTLQPLTRDPIHETTFNDTTAKPGSRYVYAIVAVDKAGNASAQSNRVEETAR